MSYKIPERGEVWKRDDKIRIVINYNKDITYVDGYGDIIWKKLDCEKIYKIWLPNWHKWTRYATKLSTEEYNKILINKIKINIDKGIFNYLKEFIDIMPKFQKRQDSLKDQMKDLGKLCVKAGLYDAHDWLKENYYLNKIKK